MSSFCIDIYHETLFLILNYAFATTHIIVSSIYLMVTPKGLLMESPNISLDLTPSRSLRSLRGRKSALSFGTYKKSGKKNESFHIRCGLYR